MRLGLLVALLAQPASAAGQTIDATDSSFHSTAIPIETVVAATTDSLRSAMGRTPGCRAVFDAEKGRKLARTGVAASVDTLAMIACHQYWVGMNYYQLTLSIGQPVRGTLVDTMQVETYQLEYNKYGSRGRGMKVYVQGNRVIAIQN